MGISKIFSLILYFIYILTQKKFDSCEQNPYIIIIFTYQSFSHQRKLMIFHWRLSDSKSPQVSRTFLSILAIFYNAVVWMVSTRPPTSKSSRAFNNPLVTVPKAPITIGIIFQPGQQSRQFCRFSFFLLIIIRSGLLAEIRWSVCISKSHRSLCVSFSRIGARLCINHLLTWSNLDFLHISQWITLPTQASLAL